MATARQPHPSAAVAVELEARGKRMNRTLLVLTMALGAAAGHAGTDGTTETRAGTPPAGAAGDYGAARPWKATREPATGKLGTLPADVGIPAGLPAPDAQVRNAAGDVVRLHDLFAKGPVLLVFYRGGWCPYCNYQIHELTESSREFRERGITPVAISVDRIEEAAATQATYEIPFPVLSDPDAAAHRAYGVVHEVTDAEASKLREFGIDLEKASGRDHHQIAIPSLFLVDRAGVVRWAHADPDYQVRPSIAEVLAVADSVRIGG